MGLGDLADDEQAEPEAVLAAPDGAAEEGLEELGARLGRDRNAAIRDGEGEASSSVDALTSIGMPGRAMGDRVR